MNISSNHMGEYNPVLIRTRRDVAKDGSETWRAYGVLNNEHIQESDGHASESSAINKVRKAIYKATMTGTLYTP